MYKTERLVVIALFGLLIVAMDQVCNKSNGRYMSSVIDQYVVGSSSLWGNYAYKLYINQDFMNLET